MTYEWIKLRKTVHGDPAVISIGADLGINADEVVGKLSRLWSWADDHLVDGNAPGVTRSWVDEHVGHVGFAAAMVKAGWLLETEAGIAIPHFDRHLSQGAKRRALTARRVDVHRESRNASVTPAALQKRYQMEMRDKMRDRTSSSTTTTTMAATMMGCNAASVTDPARAEGAETPTPEAQSEISERQGASLEARLEAQNVPPAPPSEPGFPASDDRHARHELVDEIARHLSLGYAKAARVVDELGVRAEDWRAWLAYEAEHGTALTVLNLQRFRHPKEVPRPVPGPQSGVARNGSRRSSFARPGKFERHGGEA